MWPFNPLVFLARQDVVGTRLARELIKTSFQAIFSLAGRMNRMFVTAAAAKVVFCQLRCLHDRKFLCRVASAFGGSSISIPRARSIMHILEATFDTAGSGAVCAKMENTRSGPQAGRL